MEAAADSQWQGYSMAERDRRWSAVRQHAAVAGFDCIFIPLTVDPTNLRTSSAGQRDVRFEKGNAWVWKPYAMTADNRIEFVWGGDVVVTDQGGEVLFKRPPGMVSIL
ncbi:MAG: hypothetical protein GEU73_01125 [Chloroflexi bacterium]|nr:hypothetical protein [Chloroflexota bacterium]